MSDILNECKWSTPDSYLGHNPVGDYVIYSRNRDSSILENTNYELILTQLQGEAEKYPDIDSPVYDFRASHWACGWVEYVIVDKDAPQSVLDLAEDILRGLADYPVVSDDIYSENQFNAIYEYWQDCGLKERIEWCKDAGESIFSARREDCIPSPVFDELCQHEMFY